MDNVRQVLPDKNPLWLNKEKFQNTSDDDNNDNDDDNEDDDDVDDGDGDGECYLVSGEQ